LHYFVNSEASPGRTFRETCEQARKHCACEVQTLSNNKPKRSPEINEQFSFMTRKKVTAWKGDVIFIATCKTCNSHVPQKFSQHHWQPGRVYDQL